MSYTCYLGGMEVPTPAKLTVKIKGKNKTLSTYRPPRIPHQAGV